MVAEPDSDWDQMVTKRIPRPFSTDERGGFIRADQFLEDSGAFDHWN